MPLLCQWVNVLKKLIFPKKLKVYHQKIDWFGGRRNIKFDYFLHFHPFHLARMPSILTQMPSPPVISVIPFMFLNLTSKRETVTSPQKSKIFRAPSVREITPYKLSFNSL